MNIELRYAKAVRNSSAFRAVENDIKRGEFSHAYFISSEDKDAISTLFSLIACRVYCEDACLVCPSCRKVLLGTKADVKMLAEEDKNFSVEEMSAVIESASMTSFEGCEKLYFFKNFECMAETAQNKLLKTLEEPFNGVHFFLSAPTTAVALPTVISRSKQLTLGSFSEKELKEGLIESGINEKDAERGAKLGQGSFTKARALASDIDFSRHLSEVTEVLIGLTGSSEVHRFLRSLIFGKDRFKDTIGVMELVFGDVVNYHLGLPLVMQEKVADIEKIADMYSVRAVGEAMNLLLTCRIRLRANCGAQNVADWLMLKLTEVKYKCR